jgi:hypothetical protein
MSDGHSAQDNRDESLGQELMKQSSKKWWWIGGGCVALALLGISAAIVISIYFFVSPGPLDRESAISTTKEWARLDDFPTSARNLNIGTTGSAFTREFTISFHDSPGNIRAWIAASAGPGSAKPTVESDGWTVYSYPAGSGARFAEIRVSPSGAEVRIRTYWS